MYPKRRQILVLSVVALTVVALLALVIAASSSGGTPGVHATGATATLQNPIATATACPGSPAGKTCPKTPPAEPSQDAGTGIFVDAVTMWEVTFGNNATALIDTGISDTDATITVKNVLGAFDPDGASILIDGELVLYGKYVAACTGDCDAQADDLGTFTAREVCGTGGDTCRGVPNGVAAASHSSGASVVSGKNYLLCLTRNDVAGTGLPNYDVTPVCYNSSQPAGPPTSSAPTESTSPPSPSDTINGFPAPFQAELVVGGHVPVSGAVTGNNLVLTFAFGLCLPLEPGGAKITLTMPLGTSTGGTLTGTITNEVWALAGCAGDPDTTAVGPITVTGLADDHDQDEDGCSDYKELGSTLTAGGLRDPWNVYDLFDTPVGTVGQPGTTGRNGVVNIGDVTRAIGNFNKTDDNEAASPNRNDDILATVLDPSKYHPAYDRGPPAGAASHNLSRGDGVVNIGDITRVIAQFNTVCA